MESGSIIVCKFGGSSLADHVQVGKALRIIREDSKRQYVVVSAPGISPNFAEYHRKITQLLADIHASFSHNQDVAENIWQVVRERFLTITERLSVSMDTDSELNVIREAPEFGANYDWLVSRGEYLMAKIMASALDWPFIDPLNFLSVRKNRTVNLDGCEFNFPDRGVIPGFYGAGPNRRLITLPLGGSDITQMVVGYGLRERGVICENWTDTNGVRTADPKIVGNPQLIAELTYSEMAEMGWGGTRVFHHSAVLPLRKGSVTAVIRNASNTCHPGTTLVPDNRSKAEKEVTGISGRAGLAEVSISFDGLNEEQDVLARFAYTFSKIGGVEHVVTGVDQISAIVNAAGFSKGRDVFNRRIKRQFPQARIAVTFNIAAVSVIGCGMKRRVGMLEQIASALAKKEISILFVSQPPSELSIVLGVDAMDFERATRALYNRFFALDAEVVKLNS